MVPNDFIIELPYAERMASFFSGVSGLGIPSSSKLLGTIMRSILIGKTVFCAPLSTLHWR